MQSNNQSPKKQYKQDSQKTMIELLKEVIMYADDPVQFSIEQKQQAIENRKIQEAINKQKLQQQITDENGQYRQDQIIPLFFQKIKALKKLNFKSDNFLLNEFEYCNKILSIEPYVNVDFENKIYKRKICNIQCFVIRFEEGQQICLIPKNKNKIEQEFSSSKRQREILHKTSQQEGLDYNTLKDNFVRQFRIQNVRQAYLVLQHIFDTKMFREAFKGQYTRIIRNEPQMGDIIFYKYEQPIQKEQQKEEQKEQQK